MKLLATTALLASVVCGALGVALPEKSPKPTALTIDFDNITSSQFPFGALGTYDGMEFSPALLTNKLSRRQYIFFDDETVSHSGNLAGVNITDPDAPYSSFSLKHFEWFAVKESGVADSPAGKPLVAFLGVIGHPATGSASGNEVTHLCIYNPGNKTTSALNPVAKTCHLPKTFTGLNAVDLYLFVPSTQEGLEKVGFYSFSFNVVEKQ